MNKVNELMEIARVSNSSVYQDDYGDREIRFELTWDELSVTYKYLLEEYFDEGEPGPGILFSHDYDSIGYRCPLCGEIETVDCLELSQKAFATLKEKLIQHNLKLMYFFK